MGSLWRSFLLSTLILALSGPVGFVDALALDSTGVGAFLKGSVKETIYSDPATLPDKPGNGQVFSANRQPLSAVSISIPSLGFQTVTNQNGQFSLPPLPTDRPVITAFQKQGYVPATVTLDRDLATQKKLRIALRKTSESELILDERLRHLGDGSYSPASSGAGNFLKKAEGARWTRKFRIPHRPPGDVVLEIGSVIGLDTLEAQKAGQSRFHRYSTPLRVLLNGKLVGYIALNGDRQRLRIQASQLLSGTDNVLTLETGYKVQERAALDYDDLELMLVILRFDSASST